MGAVIRETVGQAQKLLCALIRGRDRKMLADDADACSFDYVKDKWVGNIQYPKSLGELCIEVAQEKILSPDIKISSDGNWHYTMTTYYVFNQTIRRDIQALRRAMWHRGRA
jgi:hypothetical protein